MDAEGSCRNSDMHPLKGDESPASIWYAQVGATDDDVNNITVEASSKNLKVSLKRKKRYQNVTFWDPSMGTITSLLHSS